jgi:hypothetical protein
MTKEELLKKLKRLQKPGDTREDHLKADKLLLEFINDKEVTEAYNNVYKWYD